MNRKEELLQRLPQLDRIEARQRIIDTETAYSVEVACFGIIAFISAALYPYYMLIGSAKLMGLIAGAAIIMILISLILKVSEVKRIGNEYFEAIPKQKKKK